MSCVAVLGFDPGVNGGMAIIDKHGRPWRLFSFYDKMSEVDTVRLVEEAVSDLLSLGSSTCYAEKVGGRPKQSGTFVFGQSYGCVRGVLRTYRLNVHDVTPQVWQARMECLSGGNKNVTKRRATELYPELEKQLTHHVADALLISRYGWEIEAGR